MLTPLQVGAPDLALEEEWVTDFPSPIVPETGQVYSEHRALGPPVLGPASAT